MPTLVATHDGPFHADDVMAFALVRTFWDPEASVVRTRDPARIDQADVVLDVGGRWDVAARRFDHHQASYQGPWSSAGMVLDWLGGAGKIDDELWQALRVDVMEYLDAVDNGRVEPKAGVPCFPKIVEALNHGVPFDHGFATASGLAQAWLRGIAASIAEKQAARAVVAPAMERARAAGSRVIELGEYTPWKEAYFEAGGKDHPTDFVLHPGTDGSFRIVAIPPHLGSMAQKRPLPEAWAGLTDQALAEVCGVADAVFCHKNRFIAVFKTRAGALEAIRRHGLG